MYDNFGSTSANELMFTGDLSNILPSVLYDTETEVLTKPKRMLSVSARKKIAAAQRERWTKGRAQHKKTAQPCPGYRS
jgi:hypothetical protein